LQTCKLRAHIEVIDYMLPSYLNLMFDSIAH
jgi:hypothetical protein